MPLPPQKCEEPNASVKARAVPKYTRIRFPVFSRHGRERRGDVSQLSGEGMAPAQSAERAQFGVSVAISLLGPLQDVYAPFFPGPLPCAAPRTDGKSEDL
jgi:hypothetical protein